VREPLLSAAPYCWALTLHDRYSLVLECSSPLISGAVRFGVLLWRIQRAVRAFLEARRRPRALAFALATTTTTTTTTAAVPPFLLCDDILRLIIVGLAAAPSSS
jgi:hypothetical protein